jgi:hypothetical protein
LEINRENLRGWVWGGLGGLGGLGTGLGRGRVLGVRRVEVKGRGFFGMREVWGGGCAEFLLVFESDRTCFVGV